jgi:ankyrin repeat protein
MTPLHVACKYGYDDIAFLLNEYTSVEKLANSSGDSLPLHLACRNKTEKYHVVKKMLDKIKQSSTKENNMLEAVMNKLDAGRQTLLQIAVENEHGKLVELFLSEYAVSVDQEDRVGNLPVHLGARAGSTEILKLLAKHNASLFKCNQNKENALHIAAAHNRFKFIKDFILLERAQREKEAGTGPPSVKMLNRHGFTPLFSAVSAGHVKCVEALLISEYTELDAKDLDGNSIYHLCAELNNVDVLRYLLSRKDQKYVEPLFIRNNHEESVMHVACKFGHIEIIKLVLSKIYDNFSAENYLTSKNKEGKTCFHIACVKGYFNIVEHFLKDLKLGALLESTDNNMNTALHLTAQNGHLSIVNLLLDYGADIYAKNDNNNTALELSCRKGYFEISKMLINRYSQMSSTQSDKSGENPLHVACYEGAHEVVKLLLLKGAPIDRLNDENKNCLDIAISRGHREVSVSMCLFCV